MPWHAFLRWETAYPGAGGRGEVALTDRDRWIAEQVGPELVKRGLNFLFIDVIGDYLTEINVTCPTHSELTLNLV